jgi:Tfp pilus assembly protein PilE
MEKTRKPNETGRSMVEMLGVLAIVGVLSVGGISAYSTAMKKHKANEALHKASMMATMVSAYAMTNDGKLPSTITDFPNSGYTTSLTDNGTQFNLTLSGIDKDVCTQIKNSKGGMVRNVDCDEAGNAAVNPSSSRSYFQDIATRFAQNYGAIIDFFSLSVIES